MIGERLQASDQLFLHGHLLAQSGQVQIDYLPRRSGSPVEQSLRLVQRYPHQSQGVDLLQPLDVGPVVQPVTSRGPERWPEQSDLVVMVQGANGHSRVAGQLTDLPWRFLHSLPPSS